ncbi:hypothetical protein [Streptomyces sp. NPDC093097]|uniref:hypothetical protein n=1 Tax=Streptomyces sp. NPDC093097 TaxID=3366027 RepID=UPI00382DB793
MDIETLMERLGKTGVTVLLKVDEPATAKDGRTWTVAMIGPALGEGNHIHLENRSLGECLKVAFEQLREYPGDWSWLPKIA